MVTSGAIHAVLHGLNIPVDIREICVFLAPVFSGLTAFAAYKLTTEMKDSAAGLLAAIFIGIAPGYISRSVAGSYDNEGISIFLLMFTFYLWIKAVKTGKAYFGAWTALFYFYMVSAWGGYVFITNLVPLHVFVLILMGRFSNRLYVAYSSFYILGTLASMQIPFVGFQPTRTSEHMAAFGIFGLIQLIAFARLIESHLPSKQFQRLLQVSVVGLFALGFVALVGLTVGGYIAPWTGRFYSLWDTGYAKKYIPIIASVSEHQPTTWSSFFFDLQLLVPLLPAGLYFCFRELKDEHVFVILYALLASYFAGVMVRLMLTLTPIVCVAAAIAFSNLLDVYLVSDSGKPAPPSLSATSSPAGSMTDLTAGTNNGSTDSKSGKQRKSSSAVSTPTSVSSAVSALKSATASFSIDAKAAVILPAMLVLSLFVYHCTYVTQSSYSSPSVVLASTGQDGTQHIIDDFREAYYWLRMNTHPKAKVASWWDYGYQIAGFSNRTTMVDNNTWNNTHIATIGKMMSSPEDVAYEVMQKLDIDYVLVIFGGLLGYSGDDINKFLWMIRIGEGVYPNDVNERAFFTDTGDYRVDAAATPTMRNSIMYKMSYYRFSELFGGREGHDRVRGQSIPATPIKFSVLDEAFTSENMIVRIYEVKKPDNLGRPLSLASGVKKRAKNKKGGRK